VTAHSRRAPSLWRRSAGPILLVLLVLWILHKSLFSGGDLLPARPDSDLHREFLGWRYFGFCQLLHGQFPFWNPHVFCGIPFFAQIQSCLLYPIAWVNFIFNSATATTIEIAASISIAALSTYAWARQRGISRCGATLAGAAFAFSGPVYLRVMAGHVSTLATIGWTPIVFLALDRLLAESYASGILIGALAVCLQWLGGHPQMAYYTALVGGLYLILQARNRRQLVRSLASFLAIYFLSFMLAAVQIIPSYLAAQFTIRAGRPPYNFAGSLSFPPESLLSFLIPYPFGDASHIAYVGRWFIWEMSAYVGIINLTLAAIGLTAMQRSHRWRTIALLAAILLLMLGSYTPLHWWLYQYLPGFDTFRGASKFSALMALMLSILAGEGFDRIRQRFSASAAITAAIASVFFFVSAVLLFEFDSSHGIVGRLINIVFHSNQYFDEGSFALPNLTGIVTRWIAGQLCIAGVLLLTVCALLHWCHRSTRASYILLSLAIAEVFFAATFSSRTSLSAIDFPMQWIPKLQAASRADQRVLFNDSIRFGNQGDWAGYESLWGYDPGQPRRYTELIASSQGDYSTSRNTYEFSLLRVAKIFSLLRCGYIFSDTPAPAIPVPNAMPHLQLIGDYIKIAVVEKIPARLSDANFDFHHTAILETDPEPTPIAAAGRAILLHQSINDLEIQADLPTPALLLITDAYAPGWHVRPIEINSNQAKYDVLQADDVLRAIPLAQGHHHFDLYYTPPGLAAGVGVSATGFIVWAAGMVFVVRRRQRASASGRNG
jgi:hypothetical protein